MSVPGGSAYYDMVAFREMAKVGESVSVDCQ